MTKLAFNGTNLNVCPECHGCGYIIINENAAEFYGAEGMTVPVAWLCPSCNGGSARAVEQVKERANIPKTFYESKMNGFNWAAYRDQEGKIIDLGTQKRFIDSFLNDFDQWEGKGIGLYIWSHMKGSGKTFLASCICNELMEMKRITTKFVSASNLLNIAQSAQKNSLDKYEREPIELLCNCKLLVIDDIGQKNTGSEWLSDILFHILDARMTNRLVTIITSNIKLSELQMDDRIVDRINRICQPIPLPDYCVRSRESNEIKASLFRELGLIG